jgi:hypothetical protein
VTNTTEPYLSVVVTTRNDDHGGDPLQRLQAFVNCFDEQCRRTGLEAEVIVVEWNPPLDRPRLDTLVRLPDCAQCTYRFIEVPSDVHDTLRYSDVLPLFQMIAKNVGIRRARGTFVLATNIDIIFSTELIEIIAARQLESGYLYRLDRHDIQSAVPIDGPLESQLDYCASHQLRVHTSLGSYPVEANGAHARLPDDIVDGRSVRLGGGWHVREGGGAIPFYRWATDCADLFVDASGIGGMAVLELEVESNPYDSHSWVELEATDGGRMLTATRVAGRTRLELLLGDAAGERRIILRVTDAPPDSRLQLPAFERRDAMCYRLYAARLRPAAQAGVMFDYALAGWTRANGSATLCIERGTTGLVIGSDPRTSSYCVQYGPLSVPEHGTYRFEVTCSVFEGAVEVAVLSGGRSFWVPASVNVFQDGSRRRFEVSVELERHQQFWLLVSNASRTGASRFTLHDLRGSIAPQLSMIERIDRQNAQAGPVASQGARGFAKAATRLRGLHAWLAPGRWREWMSGLADSTARVIAMAVGSHLRSRIVRGSPEFQSLEQTARTLDQDLRALAPLQDLAGFHGFLHERRPDNLHVNACGDFQLMAREHWHELRGYPEFETFSMNIDGLFSYVADAAGIKERRLAVPIYHLEHEVGSGWSPEGEALLRRRIAERGITWLDATTVYIWAAYMRWLSRPMIFNGSLWGMATLELAEHEVPSKRHSAAT